MLAQPHAAARHHADASARLADELRNVFRARSRVRRAAAGEHALRACSDDVFERRLPGPACGRRRDER